MAPTRGRPMNISPIDVIKILKKYKDNIITPERKIVSKLCSIWSTISSELKEKISPASLYTFVTCNRYNVRTELLKNIAEEQGKDTTISDSNISVISNETNNSDTTFEHSNNSIEHNLQTINFSFLMSTIEFKEIIINRTYAYIIRNAKTKSNALCRQRKVFRPGIWQAVITEKIWNSTNLKCGFNFKNHYISRDATTGYINGM